MHALNVMDALDNDDQAKVARERERLPFFFAFSIFSALLLAFLAWVPAYLTSRCKKLRSLLQARSLQVLADFAVVDTGFGGDCGEDDPEEGLHEASGLSHRSTMMSETAEQPPEWFETDPLRVALKVTVLAPVMENDPKFGMRILGQEVGTKILFKFLGGGVAVYGFLAPKLFERGDSE